MEKGKRIGISSVSWKWIVGSLVTTRGDRRYSSTKMMTSRLLYIITTFCIRQIFAAGKRFTCIRRRSLCELRYSVVHIFSCLLKNLPAYSEIVRLLAISVLCSFLVFVVELSDQNVIKADLFSSVQFGICIAQFGIAHMLQPKQSSR